MTLGFIIRHFEFQPKKNQKVKRRRYGFKILDLGSKILSL